MPVESVRDERLDREAPLRRGGDHREVAQCLRAPCASVRGIGVAVSVSTSTSARSAFSCSFWRTPKRCSSSMMTSPRFLNLTSGCSSLCVPMTMSTRAVGEPFERRLDFLRRAEARQLGDLHRPVGEAVARRSGSAARRAAWSAPAPRPACRRRRATNAARSATSVLPKPTSPQTRRSIGLPRRRSCDHRVDRRLLVGRLLEAEAVGERLVVVRLEREGVALARRALRVQVQQLGGGVAHLLRRALRFAFSHCPLPSSCSGAASGDAPL